MKFVLVQKAGVPILFHSNKSEPLRLPEQSR